MTNQPKKVQPARFELLVGLHVHDDAIYDQYRARMTPLLEALGGCFRYDFRVGETLSGEASYNRVFVISFPDEDTKDAFFGDERYLAARAEFFESSVSDSAILASFLNA